MDPFKGTPRLNRRDFLKATGLAGLAVAGVAGCTESESGAAGDLVYRTWSGDQLQTYRRLGRKFAKSHPGTSLEVQVVPWDNYWTKLEAAGSAGNLPPLFWMHAGEFLLYAENEMLAPLDDQIQQADIDLSDYPKKIVDTYTYDGKQYGLPRTYDLVGLWYNKQLFDDAGVDYPDETWDWTTLREAARELTNRQRGVYGFASHLYDQTGYWNVIYQNGGQVISDDRQSSGYDLPETIEALQYWVSFILEDKTSPSAQEMAETDAFSLFQSNKVAMVFGGDWWAGTWASDQKLRETVDVAVLPKGTQRASIIHGSANSVASSAEGNETALEFAAYLSSLSAQRAQATRGTSPPAHYKAMQTWIDSFPFFNLRVFSEMVPYGVLYPHSKKTSAWQSLQEEHLPPAWAGEVSVEAAARELATAMDRVLKKE